MMVKEIEKQVEFDKDESYFKNKFLRFLFNSKENVAEGIFLVNVLIFDISLLILNFFVKIPETCVDDLFNTGLDNYSFPLALVVLGVYLFVLLISFIEVELFERYVKK